MQRPEIITGAGRRGFPPAVGLLLFCLICLFFVACDRQGHLTEINTAITSHPWTKNVGEGSMQEHYVYTFFTNGTYNVCVFNQFGTRPRKGTWETVLEPDRRVRLQLKNDEEYYYWLWRDVVVRYDTRGKVLVVSGGPYKGEEQMRPWIPTNRPNFSNPPLKPRTSRPTWAPNCVSKPPVNL